MKNKGLKEDDLVMLIGSKTPCIGKIVDMSAGVNGTIWVSWYNKYPNQGYYYGDRLLRKASPLEMLALQA